MQFSQRKTNVKLLEDTGCKSGRFEYKAMVVIFSGISQVKLNKLMHIVHSIISGT